ATPLAIATVRGYRETVKTLLPQSDANSWDHRLRSPLHMATEKGHLIVVDLLVSSGAVLPEKYRFPKAYSNWDIIKAIFDTVTAEGPHHEILKFMTCEVNGQNAGLIEWVVKIGYAPVVKHALSTQPNLIAMPTKAGKSILHLAVQPQHTAIVKLLVSFRAECNDETMIYVTQGGDFAQSEECIKIWHSVERIKLPYQLLILRESLLKILELTALEGKETIVQDLLATPNTWKNLHTALRRTKSLAVTKALLEHNKESCFAEATGHVLLCEAAGRGNNETVILNYCNDLATLSRHLLCASGLFMLTRSLSPEVFIGTHHVRS
ncbi:hypothetical protein LTR14_012093, partial [Exophiala xenobiotica]